MKSSSRRDKVNAKARARPYLISWVIGRINRLDRKVLRMRQWLAVLKLEGKRASFWKMWRALRTGGVDLAAYKQRIRTCRRCPIYDFRYRACRKEVPVGHPPTQFDMLGCGCYVPFLAKTRAPYRPVFDATNFDHVMHHLYQKRRALNGLKELPLPGGCWGRATYGEKFGWGEP